MTEQMTNSEEAIKDELRRLQRRQTTATDWDALTEGRKLLELQELFLEPLQVPLTVPEKEALHRQGLAGINGQAELSLAERVAIISANEKAVAQRSPRQGENRR